MPGMAAHLSGRGWTMADLQRPRISVLIDGNEYATSIQSFAVVADLRERAVTVELAIEDLLKAKGSQIRRGMPLKVLWEYSSDAMTELFCGVVRDVDGARSPLRVKGIDYNTILAAKRITATYQDETAEGIIRAILAESSLAVDAAESGVVIDRLPLFNVTLREAVDTVTGMVSKQTVESWYDYIRDGVFHWGTPDYDQQPVHAFRTGADVLAFRKSEAVQRSLISLIVPVQTAQVVTVDSDSFHVVRAEYRWRDGGRTVLGLEQCP